MNIKRCVETEYGEADLRDFIVSALRKDFTSFYGLPDILQHDEDAVVAAIEGLNYATIDVAQKGHSSDWSIQFIGDNGFGIPFDAIACGGLYYEEYKLSGDFYTDRPSEKLCRDYYANLKHDHPTLKIHNLGRDYGKSFYEKCADQCVFMNPCICAKIASSDYLKDHSMMMAAPITFMNVPDKYMDNDRDLARNIYARAAYVYDYDPISLKDCDPYDLNLFSCLAKDRPDIYSDKKFVLDIVKHDMQCRSDDYWISSNGFSECMLRDPFGCMLRNLGIDAVYDQLLTVNSGKGDNIISSPIQFKKDVIDNNPDMKEAVIWQIQNMDKDYFKDGPGKDEKQSDKQSLKDDLLNRINKNAKNAKSNDSVNVVKKPGE